MHGNALTTPDLYGIFKIEISSGSISGKVSKRRWSLASAILIAKIIFKLLKKACRQAANHSARMGRKANRARIGSQAILQVASCQ